MTAYELHAMARLWLARGQAAIDVSVQAHRGSVPREAGTHMLVSAHEVAGTIGGGHLELRAIEQAHQWLAEAGKRALTGPVDQTIALGPSLGQCCGGSLTLRMEPLSATSLATWPNTQPRFHLQLHGAGHVGRAIVKLLAAIDCHVSWIDARESEFTADRPHLPPHIEIITSGNPEADVADAEPGSVYLVLTHSHDLDLRITEAILRRGDFAWLGLIGSATKRARFMHRYEQRGISAEQIARITCPIGLPGIEGKEPAVIAVAVVAQLLALARCTTRTAVLTNTEKQSPTNAIIL
jgi:xanthine dehydrogenase accessory factor